MTSFLFILKQLLFFFILFLILSEFCIELSIFIKILIIFSDQKLVKATERSALWVTIKSTESSILINPSVGSDMSPSIGTTHTMRSASERNTIKDKYRIWIGFSILKEKNQPNHWLVYGKEWTLYQAKHHGLSTLNIPGICHFRDQYVLGL